MIFNQGKLKGFYEVYRYLYQQVIQLNYCLIISLYKCIIVKLCQHNILFHLQIGNDKFLSVGCVFTHVE